MKPILMLAAAAVSTCLLVPTVSQAAPLAERVVNSETIVFGDLDLATAAGRDRLDSRVRSGIRRVCAPDGSLGLSARADYRACVRAAEAASARQVQLAILGRPGRSRA